MASTQLPQHLHITGTSASDGALAFGGINLGNINYGDTMASKSSAPEAPVKPSSSTPFRRDPDFVDRGDILTQIHYRCSQPAGRVALVGLGGVGKSQLAIEYSYRFRNQSPKAWVFWVHASNTARFEAAYKEIADKLRLPRRNDSTVNVLQLVCNWLCSEGCGRWLMIIDNADDESVFYTQRPHGQGATSGGSRSKPTLASFLPQSQNGSILITSRNIDVALKLTGRDKDIIRIQNMSRNQGAALLRNKLSHPSDEPISELLDALDYMPLAIIQAAAHINKHWPRTTVASYTRELQTNDKKREKLLGQAVTDLRRDGEASNSILATWYISFERLREESPSAANLLSLMSWFNPQGIPDFLLKGYSGSELNARDENDEEDGFEEDLDMLRSYSFVTTDLNGHVFQMHRLVKFATRTWLRSFGGENRWRQKFLAILSREFPIAEFHNWSQCQRLLPHVEPIVNEEPIDPEDARFWAQILHNAAGYMLDRGLYTQAEMMIQGSISARTRLLGAEHVDTLRSVIVLSLALHGQGKNEEAGHIDQRVLEGLEKALGKEDPDTLTMVNNLAVTLQHQGKYEEAEQMYRRVLEGWEKTLGNEHPHFLMAASNLAVVLYVQKGPDEAEQMSRRVLEQAETVLGKEHPVTLRSVSDLAGILIFQKKYKESEQLNRRALEGLEKTVGKEHSDTLRSVWRLATIYRAYKRYDAASELYQRACDGLQKTLGPNHFFTVACCNSFSEMIREMEISKSPDLKVKEHRTSRLLKYFRKALR